MSPGNVAVAFDHGVTLADFERFLRKERRMNATVDDPGSAFSRHAADGVSAQCVAGVDADSDDVAGMDALRNNLFQGLIDEDGVTRDSRCCGGEDEEPSGSDDGRAKRIVAGINQVNAHRTNFPRASTVASVSMDAKNDHTRICHSA